MIVHEALERAQQLSSLNALVGTVEGAPEAARRVEERLSNGEVLPLAGVPVIVKDNLNVRGTRTTCGSHMLAHYVSPYTATAVARLEAAGAVVIGKANMDEFAMGSSTENSAWGPALNPWDTSRVPGGTSGGSAVAVAADMVPLSLGSDTGGSIRQPAAFTGVYGFKPTYGRVSRFGLVAHASSLDQIGPFATTAQDLALILDALVGHDPLDATSLDTKSAFTPALSADAKGLRVGVVRESLVGNSPDVEVALQEGRKTLSSMGMQVGEVSLPTLRYALAAYYLISTPEASSNLARYDGMVYGERVSRSDVVASMAATRGAEFGREVKRRILMGTYALSSGYYDAYYSKAMRVRHLIARDFSRAFESFDVLLTPTSPFPAFKAGEKVGDPLAMYAADVDTVGVSLAGLPAVSVPAGFASVTGRALPVGLQFIAPALLDERLLTVAAAFEGATDGAFLQSPATATSGA